jgi:hypothetical protein
VWPIVYRITTADAYYEDKGKRVYFTPEIKGLSCYRKVSDVVLRLGVWLSIIAGLGSRKASWMLAVLFGVQASKSSIDRWIGEVAEDLPSPEEMVRLLNQDKEITEGHFDELFVRGSKACVLVLKDEHGRIIATKEVSSREQEQVKPYLEWVKELGLKIKTFYIDHCQAYFNSIQAVYPEAEIQHDYFHILQNVWRHVMDEYRKHRREIKKQAEESQNESYGRRLKDFATRLWKERYLFFKSEENMTEEELSKALSIINSDNEVCFIRGFLQKVRSIFTDSESEEDARAALLELKKYSAKESRKSGFGKAVRFLETNFTHMITFLRVPGVKRNSLAESGMRVLRRLEQTHDGFRTEKGRQDALKIYQAVMYLGWSIHDPPKFNINSR